ncbi:MAG: hypothetical protein ABI693_12030 [Bryobacteraceae bacterium]
MRTVLGRLHYYSNVIDGNEQGWHNQGHADLILDNLIAEKRSKPMIIVMDNLNTAKPGEDAIIFQRDNCGRRRFNRKVTWRRCLNDFAPRLFR